MNLIPVKWAKGLLVNERAKEAKREREKGRRRVNATAVVVCACASEVERGASASEREKASERAQQRRRFGVSPARLTLYRVCSIILGRLVSLITYF